MEEMNGQMQEVINDDLFAEKVIIRRAERIAERDRLLEVAKAYYEDKVSEITAKYDNGIKYDEALLYTYAQMMPMKETATQKTYKLPSGTLKITKAKQDLTPDREALVTFMENGGGHEWIKVKKDIDWAGLKKTITIVDGKAVWEQTGEILDCVEVTEKAESFSIS